MEKIKLGKDDVYAVITIYKDQNNDIQIGISKSDGMSRKQLISAVAVYLINLRMLEAND